MSNRAPGPTGSGTDDQQDPFRGALDEPTTGGQLIVNLRAEADPATLMNAVKDGLAEATLNFFGLKATLDHEEHFRPGKPTPTHRDGEVVMETKGGCKPGSGCC